MNWYTYFKLVNDGDGYTVTIYLNPEAPEFSEELVTSVKENVLELDDQIRKLIKEKFSDIKVNTVKLMLGTLVIASMPFMTHTKAHAEETTPSAASQSYGVSNSHTTGVVSATRLNVRKGPSTDYSSFYKLQKGSSVEVVDVSNGWCKIQLPDGRIGWVSKDYLKLATTANSREQKIQLLLSSANSLVGTPYVWGGSSMEDGGFDCSGFTQFLFKKAGYNLNRISIDQAKQGLPVSRDTLQPGDLVFFSLSGTGNISHVGLYLGNGKMIHSPKTGDTVKFTDITTSFWQDRFITARRIFQ